MSWRSGDQGSDRPAVSIVRPEGGSGRDLRPLVSSEVGPAEDDPVAPAEREEGAEDEEQARSDPTESGVNTN